MPRYGYVTVGHVTVDVLGADGSRHPGGTAFYSALQAARLGMRALIVTRGVPAEIEELLAPYRSELDLMVLPSEHTTTLRTWGEGRERRQRLLAWAGAIDDPIEVDTTILHLAPVVRETPYRSFDTYPRAGFVGLTPQGLVREWNDAGDIVLAPPSRGLLPERCDALVLSERERESCAELILRGWTSGAVVAVTAGPQPTAIHLPSSETLGVPVPPIEGPREDIGAGDVFAAAFFIALRARRPPAAAAAFANAAAAVRIAGSGPGAIGNRRAIEAQLRIGR